MPETLEELREKVKGYSIEILPGFIYTHLEKQ